MLIPQKIIDNSTITLAQFIKEILKVHLDKNRLKLVCIDFIS